MGSPASEMCSDTYTNTTRHRHEATSNSPSLQTCSHFSLQAFPQAAGKPSQHLQELGQVLVAVT